MTTHSAQIWEWLADVPDPEIPVISIVDLGIVRDVTMRDGICEVTITPTYSGCPGDVGNKRVGYQCFAKQGRPGGAEDADFASLDDRLDV